MTVIVNDYLDVTAIIKDTAGSVASLSITLAHTDETPIVALSHRVNTYLTALAVGVDWGTTSKIYKAAQAHYAQKTHNQFFKVGREIPKGATQSSNDITTTAEIATLTDVTHGLIAGQEVTVGGAASAGLNGLKTILDVPTADTFTYDAPGVTAGADANNGSIAYHVGDLDMTTALGVILAEDGDFITLNSIKKLKAEILEIAAFTSGKNFKYITSSEDANVKNQTAANVLISLEALSYSNVAYIWRHQAGVDAAGVDVEVSPELSLSSIVVADEVATAVAASKHGLAVGDQITVADATPAGLNGLKTITAILTEFTFTFAAASVVDGAATGTIVYVETGSEKAIVTEANHGLRVDDPLTVSGATPADLNGNKVVLYVIDANTFQYSAADVVDGAATGTINYFARYLFFETAVTGLLQSKDIGTVMWDANGGLGSIQGQIATPISLLSEAEIVNIIGVNGVGGQSGNVYINRLGFDVFTKGWMVNQRFIGNEDVRIWLEQRWAEAIMAIYGNGGKSPYTNSGLNIFLNAISGPTNTQLDRTGLNPLSETEMDDIIDGEAGANDLFQKLAGYVYIYQNMDTISDADRILGNVPDVRVYVKIGQAIHRIEVNATAQV